MNEKKKATTVVVLNEHTTTKSRRSRCKHLFQNFLLVWLDENIDEKKNDDCRNTITKLLEVVNTVKTFTDIGECINFIADIKNEKVFIISSGSFGQTTVPIVHDMAQVGTIYIFCGNKSRHEQWAHQWSKVQGVFTDINRVCEALKKAVHECDQNTISMSFVDTSTDTTNKNLDQLDQSFMYTQILKEILLTIDFEREHIKEFINYCREQFEGNPVELKKIDMFETEYRQHTPIWWYTYHCFLYSMLNRALRTMEVDVIINLGFFIRDLHKHITELHREQYTGDTHSNSFVVYRGQGLSEIDFEKLKKTKGGLLSFNSFLSTSTDPQVSHNFARRTIRTTDLIGIVFITKIDPTILSTPFADVRDVSYYKKEKEILFSMHSIFRIIDIKQLDNSNNRLWQVELILTSDNDPQLHALTNHIRKETHSHKKGWYQLAGLLIKLGQFNKAEQVCQIIFKQTSSDNDKATVYHMLGMIKNHLGKHTEAVTFYEESNNILQKTLPENHADLASSYNNIGNVYFNNKDYPKALLLYKKALEIYEKTLAPNHPHLAIAYNNIGMIYNMMGKYSEALSFYEKMLEIEQKSLPQNHPSLAISYNNIASLYEVINERSKALSYYKKGLKIEQENLPPNHPESSVSYSNIGFVYAKMGDYPKALSFLERALDIAQHSLPENHRYIKIYKGHIQNVKKKMEMGVFL